MDPPQGLLVLPQHTLTPLCICNIKHKFFHRIKKSVSLLLGSSSYSDSQIYPKYMEILVKRTREAMIWYVSVLINYKISARNKRNIKVELGFAIATKNLTLDNCPFSLKADLDVIQTKMEFIFLAIF